MKPPWKLLLVFALGVAVGVAGTLSHLRAQYGKPGHISRQMLDQFSRTLRMTPEQRENTAAIFEEKRQKINALRLQVRPRFQEIRTAAAAEIRALLTPEQQPAFDRLQAEWEARRERRRSLRE